MGFGGSDPVRKGFEGIYKHLGNKKLLQFVKWKFVKYNRNMNVKASYNSVQVFE